MRATSMCIPCECAPCAYGHPVQKCIPRKCTPRKCIPPESASPKSASMPIMYRHYVRTILYYGIFALSISTVIDIFRNGAILHVTCTIGYTKHLFILYNTLASKSPCVFWLSKTPLKKDAKILSAPPSPPPPPYNASTIRMYTCSVRAG